MRLPYQTRYILKPVHCPRLVPGQFIICDGWICDIFISTVSETCILSPLQMVDGRLFNVSKLVCKGYISFVTSCHTQFKHPSQML